MKKILIAENDETSIFYYKEVLSDLNIEVLWATNGKDAIEIFEKNQDINLIIMDIEMPVMDGLEATAEIRKKSDVHIIILTSYTLKTYKEKAESLNVDKFLNKPIRAKEFLELVKQFV